MIRVSFFAALCAAALALAACSGTKAVERAPEPVAAPITPPFDALVISLTAMRRKYWGESEGCTMYPWPGAAAAP